VQVIPTQELADDAAELFRLLGDPTRIRILQALADSDELCVHEIAEAVGARDTKVSQALRLLRTAGVVRNRRDGRHIHYRLDDEHVRILLTATLDHLDHIDQRAAS
jgi:DNA-binding transcriptional ArsR family regulator